MEKMELQVRVAAAADFTALERMVIDSFGPITWARTLDERFGALNGLDWRERWRLRLQRIFADQIVLVGEAGSELAAMSSGTVEGATSLAYIDLLAVSCSHQGRGYGRDMLRATIRHMGGLGAEYVNLDCLTTNDNANALYRSEGFEEVARHIRWFRKI